MPDKTIIETARLILRPWREEDAEALYRYASDDRVSEPALWPTHTSVECSRQVIRDFFIPNGSLAMVLKDSGEPVGCIGFVPAGMEHFSALPGEHEVGYWIGYPYWGLGLTTEALQALVEYCGKKSEISSLLITAAGSNTGSRRVAEKCGFQQIAGYLYEGIESVAYRLIPD